jgi:uncharacterized protein DUF1579
MTGTESTLEALEPFVGEWTIEAELAAATPDVEAKTVFEWMAGKQFLVQRWEIPVPEAPDGLAVIGFDEDTQLYLQHYFDSRGVARLYEMTFSDGVWKLWRKTSDFTPLSFSQRFTGEFGEDGNSIEGRWEIAHDHTTWEHDFDLTYRRIT